MHQDDKMYTEILFFCERGLKAFRWWYDNRNHEDSVKNLRNTLKHFPGSYVLRNNYTYSGEVSIMTKESDSLKQMIVKLSEVGVKITKTKSRLEVLRSLNQPQEMSSPS